MPASTAASPDDPFAEPNQAGQDLGDLEDLGAGAEEMTEFMAVLMEFAAPAFIHLGLAEHPATGRPQVNLPAAKQSIDMLRVLREKTKGNLSRDEDRFFEGLLSDLQMQFVSLRSSSPGR
jgi:hypothetical protein